MKRLGLTLVWVFAASVICSAQTLYYPQIANGQNGGVIVVTWLFVTNPNGSETATGSIQFTQDNGTPFNITFIDVDSGQLATTRNILTFENLSPGQTRIYLSTGTGPLQQGFGTLNSGVRVTSTALFSTYTSSGGPGNPGGIGAVYAEAGVAAVTSSLRQGVFFYAANNFDTGIALANPDPTNAATITLNIFDRNAIALSPPKVITLAPSNHMATYVSQLYPNAVGEPALPKRRGFEWNRADYQLDPACRSLPAVRAERRIHNIAGDPAGVFVLSRLAVAGMAPVADAVQAHDRCLVPVAFSTKHSAWTGSPVILRSARGGL